MPGLVFVQQCHENLGPTQLNCVPRLPAQSHVHGQRLDLENQQGVYCLVPFCRMLVPCTADELRARGI